MTGIDFSPRRSATGTGFPSKPLQIHYSYNFRDASAVRWLARNLAVAFITTRQGIGLDYARKTYAHEPVGEFWISVARMVLDHLVGGFGKPPDKTPVIH